MASILDGAKDGVELVRDNSGQGGDGGRADDPEIDPTPEETHQPAITLAQENIVPAGARVKNGNFGHGQGTKKGQHASKDPDERNAAEVGYALGDRSGFHENARADHRSDDDGGGHQRAEGAR